MSGFNDDHVREEVQIHLPMGVSFPIGLPSNTTESTIPRKDTISSGYFPASCSAGA